MSPLHLTSAPDSVDEVPIAELPSYGDPERTDPFEIPDPRVLGPDISGWLGDEPPSLAALVPERTDAMANPIWNRTDPVVTERLLNPRFLVLSVAMGAVVGASAVFFAALLGGLLGFF